MSHAIVFITLYVAQATLDKKETLLATQFWWSCDLFLPKSHVKMHISCIYYVGKLSIARLSLKSSSKIQFNATNIEHNYSLQRSFMSM